MPSNRPQRRQKTNSAWIVGGLILLSALVVALVVLNSNGASQAGSSFAPPPSAPLDKCGSPACGQANAPVTLDVHADFQCPYCQAFEPALEQLGPSYIDTGKVKLVYHNFPLIGPESETAAQAVLCAGDQGKFWFFAHDLFTYQGAENSGVFTAANLKSMAAAAGFDTAAFNGCLDGSQYAGQVISERSQGQRLGVTGTPTFFINGQIHAGGVTYAELTALLDAALAK